MLKRQATRGGWVAVGRALAGSGGGGVHERFRLKRSTRGRLLWGAVGGELGANMAGVAVLLLGSHLKDAVGHLLRILPWLLKVGITQLRRQAPSSMCHSKAIVHAISPVVTVWAAGGTHAVPIATWLLLLLWYIH